MNGRTRSPRSGWMLWLLLPLAAGAADVQVNAGLGVGRTDNVRRVPVAEESATISQATLQFAVAENTRRMVLDVAADLAFQDYADNAYDSELIGSLDGQLSLAFVPDRLLWVTSDRFGQTRPDLFAAATPENRENINYFSTGPDGLLRFGESNRMRLGARYSRVDFETSPYDSERASGSLALQHDMSSGGALSLNVATERVDFALAGSGADYDRRQVFVGYDIESDRMTLHAAAGASQIDRDDTRQNSGLLRLDVERRIATRSLLTLGVGRELTDAGSLFGQLGQTSVVSASAESLARTSNPFTSEHVRAGWDVAGRVTRLGVSGSLFRESYEQSPALDRDRAVVEAHIFRQLGSRLGARLTASHARDNFRNVAGDANESGAVLGLSWRVGRQLSVDLSAERSERDADNPLSDYTENRAWLNVRWGTEFIRRVGSFGSL